MSFDNLPFGWKLVTLEDAMDAIIDYRGKTPKKTESGIPLITAKIVKGGYVLEPFEFIAKDNYDSWMVRGRPQVGDVVLTTEAPLGETAQLTSSNVALAQRIVTLRGKKGLLDNDFLLCVLQSDFVQHQLESRASGSTVKGIKQSELRKISLPIPPLHQQKKISQVLKSLSNKLVCNTQTNQTLEQMAQAIFESWFVDFDPVKARMNGEQPEGMDSATASLFPDKFVESELGLIPLGWEVKPFSEWVKITKGKNITKKTIVDGDIPVVAGGLNPAYFHNAHNVDGPAITISASGANAGYVNLYFENIWASDCSYVSQSTTPLFFLHYVALRYNQKKIFDMQTGAAQPHIYPRDFERLMIAVPNEELCRKLEKVFASFFGTVANNKQQNIELTALRNTLLPKLLSGEIELRQAQ